MKINLSLRIIRYFLFGVSIVILTSAIQIFVQNFKIEKEINNLKNKQYELSQDTLWRKKFYEPYLNSEYSSLFFAHKAGVVGKNEKIVKIILVDSFENQPMKDANIISKEKTFGNGCFKFFKMLYYKYF